MPHSTLAHALTLTLLLVSPAASQVDPSAEHLPDTEPLELDEPLDVVMVRGINYFAERELAASPDRRAEKWNRDYSSPEAYEASVAENRERLRTIIGAVDDLPETSGLSHHPLAMLKVSEVWNDHDTIVVPVSWDVMGGITGEGYMLTPQRSDVGLRAAVVLIPDAGTSPEALVGLTNELPPSQQLARRLAASGCVVLVVAPINRDDTFSGHPDIRYTNLPHREFIYRMAFEMGRHLIGYEAQRIRAALGVFDLYQLDLSEDEDLPIAVAGVGEGGLLALYAAAVEPRFDAAFVSGYFQEREGLWREPIYRNVWSLLSEFGDADIASLIAPRHLIIEAAAPPPVDGPPQPRDGRAANAAPGRIETPPLASVEREFQQAREHYARLSVEERIKLVATPDGEGAPGSDAAISEFLSVLGIDKLQPPGDANPSRPVAEHLAKPFDAAAEDRARQQRQFDELVRHTQRLMHSSDKERDRFWSEADRSSVAAWVESTQWYRDYIHDHMIGRLPLPTMPLNPRSRKVIDEPTHVGYEIMLDCYPAGDDHRSVGPAVPDGDGEHVSDRPAQPDLREREHADDRRAQPDLRATDDVGWAVGEDHGVIAGGILLLPKDLEEGERRPVVVFQHGLEGTPMDTITTDESTRAWRAYKGVSTQLVERGFIVYAPQNPYRGGDSFRVIQRKSNPMGRSLFSYIIEQHRRTLQWLASLPYIDAERIAFYGLSYGGKTAVRVPPLLVRGERRAESGESDDSSLNSQLSPLNSPQYCLSICSADFNEWIRKNVSAEDRYSYIFTGEYEMFEWNMGHVANYAELANLMTPRPFMVERGHDDGVAPDEWVAWEYAKVRRHYDRLGLGERTEIEWFNGPHTINGEGTFEFLHRHLAWPQPPAD